ncbi:transketolase [Rubellimicrobium aerolatum]|uniref:Transketolase n=1 Tax=Rubellimicrobium aerolatum TaxID=490979 RepID=A0ABW0SBV0_9RHOB|nr:transketolase [Rubellimicrobium aerolatum]MBP1805987.1 transketolase [Rubellimicrobium aerolatum]
MDIASLRNAHFEHWRLAAAIRTLTLDAVAQANSGHSGMPMGMADVATVLFDRHLRFDPKAPFWPDRDRFILSAGHGSMLIYSLLYLTGYPDMTLEQVKDFRQWGSRTPGHPEVHHTAGVETTTGPLGQGIANAVGFAIAEEALRARFGAKVMDHHTYVIAGDGCLMEGVSQEAIALAGRQQLGRLIVLFDDNGITIDGKVSIADATDQGARFAASGWHVQAIDGHDPQAIDAALTAAKADPRPSMIACKTHIALGSSAQDTAKGHGALTDAKLIADTREVYGWEHGAFDIPADIKARWEQMGQRGAQARAEWEERVAALPASRQAEIRRVAAGEPPRKLAGAIRDVKTAAIGGKAVATRKSSEIVLEAVNAIMPETLGGSADLTGSNNTRTADLGVFEPGNRKGRYVHYGIREHGMAAAMNGIALHGGLVPYGGTFLCFADYCRPSVRLSALMGAKVVYVFTHDSIGLGEDGPTHQPVEHLAMLRATPGLRVFRPADTVETAEAWELALTQPGPSVLALSRQNLRPARTEHTNKNLTAQGAYVLVEATAKRQVVLIATGSEVEIALAAREALEAEGIGTRVVSMPSMELFAAQDERVRRRVLPPGTVRVAVEAGVRQPWDRWLLGQGGREAKSAFVGMSSFGASAPAEVLYEQFGITAANVAGVARSLL